MSDSNGCWSAWTVSNVKSAEGDRRSSEGRVDVGEKRRRDKEDDDKENDDKEDDEKEDDV